MCSHPENGRIDLVRLLQRGVRDTRQTTLADVVDDIGPKLLHGHAGHVRAERIDGDNRVGQFASHDIEGEAQALHLFRLGHLISTWTGREGTHVNDRTALLHNLIGTLGNLPLRLLPAPCIERVGRHVKDTHHLRLTKIHQAASNIDRIVHFAYKDTNLFIIHNS